MKLVLSDRHSPTGFVGWSLGGRWEVCEGPATHIDVNKWEKVLQQLEEARAENDRLREQLEIAERNKEPWEDE